NLLAPPVQDGFGAAIGQQITTVADPLDNQRNRNVVDDEFQKLLRILQFARQRPAVRDVLEHRDQERRLVIFVADDRAVGGKDTLLPAALDRELAAMLSGR